MIYQRHIIKSIFQGTLVTLFVLTCISVFVTFVAQLDSIGTRDYGFNEAILYVLLKIPKQIVFSLPISVFIGSILSLGALAANNEIVVLQSSGMSIKQLFITVLKAAVFVALLSVAMQQWVTPLTESTASAHRAEAKYGLESAKKNKSIWFKEENRVIYIKKLNSLGEAKEINIFELTADRKLAKAIRAETAVITHQGWQLNNVDESELLLNEVKVRFFKDLIYPGELSENLLKSMRLEPVQMSLTELFQYQSFLHENGLENEAEQIMFWRRVYSPFAILITCTLAIPFVLGSQRGGQTGQRVMIGIMIGLSFVAIDRLVVRMSQYLGMIPQISTLIPLIIFLSITLFLMARVIRKKE